MMSVLISRDSVRYEYDHSILSYEESGSAWSGKRLDPGNRVSIMIRVSEVFLTRLVS
jgi:alkylated DNA repair protein alkB family protein 7